MAYDTLLNRKQTGHERGVNGPRTGMGISVHGQVLFTYTYNEYTVLPSSPLLSRQALLQAVNNASGREDIIEPAMCALRHITSRHPSADIAQNTVRQVGGIPVISAFLNQQCRWPLLKVYTYTVDSVQYVHTVTPPVCVACIFTQHNFSNFHSCMYALYHMM